MDINAAVKEAIRQNPQVREDFKKSPKVANKLIGAVRKLGCMADPKAVKRLVYAEFGSVWDEEEKKPDVEVRSRDLTGFLLWRNTSTGDIVRRDFQYNENGSAIRVGVLWVYYSKYPGKEVGDNKIDIDEWLTKFEHVDTGRSYNKTEYIRRFTRINDKKYVPEDNS